MEQELADECVRHETVKEACPLGFRNISIGRPSLWVMASLQGRKETIEISFQHASTHPILKGRSEDNIPTWTI